MTAPPERHTSPWSRGRALGGALLLGGLVVAVVLFVARAPGPEPSCGAGFVPRGARCCAAAAGPCGAGIAPVKCPTPLVTGARGCVARETRVPVPETDVVVGPADWEAEGRVAPRRVHTAPFWIDAFEAQVEDLACPTCLAPDPAQYAAGDPARAMGGVSLALARRYCAARGGRLPTDDEWLVAAAGARPRRYPWGDTGAVCRRAAWGLVAGPCGAGAAGPDTVGAHVDGDTPLGVHDLAGNVAEWVEHVEPVPPLATAGGRLRGGSFATSLATELRTWSSRDVGPEGTPEAGVRCAFDSGPLPALP